MYKRSENSMKKSNIEILENVTDEMKCSNELIGRTELAERASELESHVRREFPKTEIVKSLIKIREDEME